MLESGNKIRELKIYERKLHNVCISTEGTAVKSLASEFLTVMEIMTKHYRGHFLWDTGLS